MEDPQNPQRFLTAGAAGLAGCRACGTANPGSAQACICCGNPLQSAAPDSLQRVWAWLAAGLIAYVPANTYPMLRTTAFGRTSENTLIGGIAELFSHGSYAVALIVFLASIVIPVAKFLAIGYLAVSVRRPAALGSHGRLVLYEVVEFIGRWSMIDVFVVAILTALVQLDFAAAVAPGMAAVSFALSVAFTMLAAQSFDPRLIWNPESENLKTTPDPARMNITPRPRSPWRNLSLVWLVPLAALLVSLGVAWQAYSDRGVLITISFENASGISASETTVRYRDVVIGRVEKVGFSSDLSKVSVQARIDKDVAPYLDADAAFWVVRPEVSARGISGLSTVLSGVYIEGSWDQDPGLPQTVFEGADRAPLAQPGRGGRRITLRTDDGRMVSEGAPVLFRGIEVGRLEKPRLTVNGDSIVVDAFIEAPHDRRINSATRFWDSSGFSVSIGPSGLSLDVDSIASLVAGGIEFGSVFDGGNPVGPSTVFDIHADEAAARRTAFARALSGGVAVSVAFDESVAGLASGAAVQLRGVKVGEVSSLNASIRDSGEAEVQLIAKLLLEPALMGLPRGAGEAEALDFLEQAVENGLRARLASASLFSSELIVELVTLEDAAPADFARNAEPFPQLPSAPSNLPDFTATAEGMLDRINALPVEELMAQTIATLSSIEDLAASDSTRQAPAAAVALLEDTRALVTDPGTRALPGELQAAVADMRALLAELQQGRAAANLATALEKGSEAAAGIADAAEDLPALITAFNALAAKANSLETEELIRSARQLMNSADALIGTEDARALPPALTGALGEMRATLEELRQGGLVENANATMASARGAADAVAAAAEGLPALSARLERLVAQSEALIASYGARSSFNSETLDALREIKAAARAVSLLARKIERDPNSLLFGK